MRRLISSLALVILVRAEAQACVMPPPMRVRTTDPVDGETGVPTSVRPRVTYGTGPGAETMCGAPPAAPIIRLASPDGGVPDGGATLAGTWVKATDSDPHNGVVWEFHPAAPLAASTMYELVDTWPASCPCQTGPCKPTPEAVFVRFTTGDMPDARLPEFGGISGEFCSHDVCAAADQTCCGPYDHMTMHFITTNDPKDANLRGIHLYARLDSAAWDFTHPVGGLFLSDPLDAPAAGAWDMTLSPGKYHVIARAYDSSGNEDANMLEVVFTYPLSDEPRCQELLVDAAMRPGDMAYRDPYDFSGMSADMSSADSGGTCTTACAVGGRRPRGSPSPGSDSGRSGRPLTRLGPLPWAVMMALAAITVRRGRRRSRREGGAEAP